MKDVKIQKTFGNNMTPRFVVVLDRDAAEIMGETKMRYVFGSKTGAEKFATVLQSNLDAAYADACGE
jgi:hypothetical protein